MVNYSGQKNNIYMIKYASLFLALIFSLNSCGKKEETQTQQEQQTQQNQQQQTQSQQTQTTEPNKEADKKKGDEEKKKKEDEEKKKKEEEMTKKEHNGETTQIDFAPIYTKRCVKCHGANGKGKIEGVPDLTSSKTKSKSDKQLYNIISNGVKAETEDGEDMPAWKGKLTEDEIHAAVKFVKSL